VRGVEGGEDPEADVGGHHRGQRPVFPDDVAQRRVREVLHDDPGPVVLGDDVEDADDVRVAEPGGRLRFAQGTAARRFLFLVFQVRGPAEFLHGHVTIQQLVLGVPHDAHSAAADHGIEPVASRQNAHLLSSAHDPPIPS
jgi:hypothetical protein